MKKLIESKHKIILIAIIVAGFLLRFWGSWYNFAFTSEHAEFLIDVQGLRDLVVNREPSFRLLVGPEASIDFYVENRRGIERLGSYHGAIYYYLLLGIGLLTGFSPQGIILILVLLGTVSIYLGYLVAKKMYGAQVGLIAALIFALSYQMLIYTRNFWQPSFIPFFVLIALNSLLDVLRGEKKSWYLLGLSTVTVSQIHNSGYWFLAFIGIVLFLKRPKFFEDRRRKIFLAAISFLPLLPTIIFEIWSGFVTTRTVGYQLAQNFLVGSGELGERVLSGIVTSFFVFLTSALAVYGHLGEQGLSSLAASLVLLLVLLFGLMRFKKEVSRQNGELLFVWFLTFFSLPWLAKLYYGAGEKSSITWMNNLLVGFPFVVMLVSVTLGRFFSQRLFAPLGVVLLLFIVYTNLLSWWKWNQVGFWKPYFGDKMRLIQALSSDAGDRLFELRYLQEDRKITTGEEFIYLFKSLSGKLPERFNGEEYRYAQAGTQRLGGRETALTYTIVQEGRSASELGSLVGRFDTLALYRKGNATQ